MTEKRQCYCDLLLGLPSEQIFIHLLGCPKDSYSKKWENMKWYQKIFHHSPEDIYSYHFKP